MTELTPAQKHDAAVVRTWILMTGRAFVPVEPERRDDLPLSRDVAAALDALPEDLHRARPEGRDVILADLNYHLGRETWDRVGDDGVEYGTP